MSRTMTAEFPTRHGAESLYAAFNAELPSWFIEPGSLRLDDRTVTWRTDARADTEPAAYVMDMRETVAYYGSGSRPPYATLNGHPCRGTA